MAGKRIALFGLLVCLLALGFYRVKPHISVALQSFKDAGEIQRVREKLLALEPNLARLSGRELVTALRDIAYTKVKVGTKGGNLFSPWEAFRESVIDQTAEHSCQGVNIVYRVMLTAFGIKSREVDFYGDDEVDPGELLYSHATTSVYLDGKWEASDATFNVVVKDDSGNRLSWLDAFKRERRGQKIVFERGSEAEMKFRTAADAREGIGKAMKFMFVIGDEVETHPVSWNGKIQIEDRTVDFATESQPIYFRLADLVD